MEPVTFARKHLARYATGFDGCCAAMREDFTDRTVWENVGLSLTTGADEAIALMRQFREQLGMDRLEIDVLAAVSLGNSVLTERVDHLLRADGSIIASIRLMGTLEVDDGKIVAWRDYFDTAGFQQAC